MFLQLGTGPRGAGARRFLGEAKDAEYRDQIEINDWKWSLLPTSDSSSMAGSGANSSQTVKAGEPSVLGFSKTMCRATSGMLKAMQTGEHLYAVFSLEEDSDVDFLLTLTLTDVRIIGYELDINGSEVTEEWKLDYSKIKFLYRRNYEDITGDLVLELKRSPNASKDTPGGTKSKILDLAKTMNLEDLGPLAKELEQMSMAKNSVHNKSGSYSQKQVGS
jgi:type VI protein secretion system component Hcp